MPYAVKSASCGVQLRFAPLCRVLQVGDLMATPQSSRATALFVDAGWGDWRLADNVSTRVTAEQVAAIGAMPDVESVGASEVRFGKQTGELCVFHTEGRVTEVAEDGQTETFRG